MITTKDDGLGTSTTDKIENNGDSTDSEKSLELDSDINIHSQFYQTESYLKKWV